MRRRKKKKTEGQPDLEADLFSYNCNPIGGRFFLTLKEKNDVPIYVIGSLELDKGV